MNDLTVSLRLTADAKGLVGEVRLSAEELKKLGVETGRAGAAATSAATAQERLRASSAAQTTVVAGLRTAWVNVAAAVFAAQQAFALVTRVVSGFTRAAVEAEQAELRLAAVVRATGGVAGLTAQDLIRMADAFQARLGINDEAIKGSMAVLLTFRSVSRESFGEAMEVAANLSKVMGTDLQSATLQLGKALEEPEQGLTALRRSGVSFSDTQKEMIKDLVETGRQGEAITHILRIMKEQGLDKVAEAMHQGLDKATTDLKNNWDDLLDRLGRTDAVKTVVGGVLDFISTRLRAIVDDSQRAARAYVELTDELFRAENDLLAARAAGNARAATAAQRRIDRARGGLPAAQRAMTPGEDAGNLVDMAADVEALRSLEAARDAYASFARQFAGDAEKQAEALKKLEALYRNGAMSAAEYAKTAADIRARFAKKETGQGPFPEMLKALEREIALGKEATAVEKLRFDLEHLAAEQRRKITPEQEAVLAQKAREIDLLRETERLTKIGLEYTEAMIKAEADREAVYTDMYLAMSEHAKSIEEETRLLGMNTRERELAVEMMKLERLEQAALARVAEEDIELRKRITDEYARRRAALPALVDARVAARERQQLIEDTRRDWERMQDDLKRGLTDSIFRGLEAGKPFGRLFFDSLKHMAATTVLRPVVEFAMAPWSRAIAQLLGSLGLPGLPAPPAVPAAAPAMPVPLNASVAHAGGVPAYDALPTRTVSAALFAAAPRLHAGIGPGERAAILREDEAVLTPGQMRMLAPSRPPQVVVNVHNPPGEAAAVERVSAPRFEADAWVIDVWLARLRRDGGLRETTRRLLAAPA
jgi:hypothetical protein